jgi:hypothetical protein
MTLSWLDPLKNPRVLIPSIAFLILLSLVALQSTTSRTPGQLQTTERESFAPGESGEVLPGDSSATQTGTASPGGSARAASRGARTSTVGPGILPADKTPLKLGAITPKGDPAAAFGASLPLPDIPHLIRSMEKEINESGGIAGRPIEVIIKEVDTTDQDAANQSRLQNEACKSLTEDHRVFMVSGATEYTFRCYADHKTPMVQAGRVLPLADEKDTVQYRPWLMPTSLPLLDSIARSAPEAWAQEGAITEKMGFIGYEIPALRRTAPMIISEIEKRGGKILDQGWSAVTYRDSNAMISQKVLDFNRQGINRVFFWAPGGGAWLSFSRNADAQLYYPRYLLTSHDYPQSMIETFGPGLPESQLPGTINASSKFLDDVSERAFPLTEREKSCLATVNKRAKTNYQTRSLNDGAAGLTICETFYLIRTALAPATGKALDPLEIPNLVAALGKSYKPVMWPEYSFAPGKPDASSLYGRGYYDNSPGGCRCFAYRNPAFYPVP